MLDSRETRPLDPMPSGAEWRRLTVVPEKRAAFSTDLYFRECWADLVDVFGARATDVLGSLAILSLKPDAVVGRRTTRLLEFVAARAFAPVGLARLRLTRASMHEVWRYDWNNYTVDRLEYSTLRYTATDVLMLALYDVAPDSTLPASVRLGELKGVDAPEKRTAEHLRTALGSPNRILNFVHVADEPADVVREIGIFLGHRERRALLREIRDNLDDGGEVDVAGAIAGLEAGYPEHDLDLSASLERLAGSPALSAEEAARLRELFETGTRVRWDELCSLVDPSDPEVDTWDFLCVASELLPLDRNAPPCILPPVDLDEWARRERHPEYEIDLPYDRSHGL